MNKNIEVTWAVTLMIWWSYLWRLTVWGMLFGAIAGFLAGIFSALTNISNGATLGAIAGYFVSLPVSIWCMKTLLTKKFKKYHIIVVSHQ